MKKVLCALCSASLLGSALGAQRASVSHAAGVVAIPVEDAADSLYRAGRAALNDRDYRRAGALFKQLVDKYPSSPRAGDALYWRAWALYQLGSSSRSRPDLDDALATVDKYNTTYGKTGSMTSDAIELHGQIRTAQAKLGDANAASDIATAAGGLRQARACNTADDEMRKAALQGLLSMNSEDAVPILKDVLKQRDPCREQLRKQAVWMIAQKESKDVVATLLDVARNDPSSDVRGDAIFWLSQARSAEAIPALDSILSTSRDDELRKKAIFSLAQQRDERARQALKRAAENENMAEELRGEAVFWLGEARVADLDYFKTLFRKTRNAEIRSKIVQAVSNSSSPEAGAWLLDIARDKSFDIETRKNAIFWASQRRTLDFDQLAAIYDQSKGDDEMQKHVIFILSQRREPAAVDKLMVIAKGDGDIEMRKQALFWLGQKNDPRIRQFIRDLINK